MLRTLLPEDADVAGLLALILLTDARRESRTDHTGRLLLLAEQDRTRWDHAAITEGTVLVREALRWRPPGRFALMAAIAAVHDEAPTYRVTDWREIVALYDLLTAIWPSPVVALNRLRHDHRQMEATPVTARPGGGEFQAIMPGLAAEWVAQWCAGRVDDRGWDEFDVAGVNEDFPTGAVHVPVMRFTQ